MAFLAILHHSLFLIASSSFTSASPFLVPVLYISPSLEKDVVLNIDEWTVVSCSLSHITVPCILTYVVSLGGQKYPG